MEPTSRYRPAVGVLGPRRAKDDAASGAPVGAQLELWALSSHMSTGLRIRGCCWAPSRTRHSRMRLAGTASKEQPQGWHLHHLSCDMKGITCLAFSALWHYSLLQSSLHAGAHAILTLHFRVIETVFCTDSSMA